MRGVNSIIWGVAILAIIVGLSYSVFVYYESDADSGIIICNDAGECNIALHIHADIDMEVCGEKVNFPLETGDLAGQHTHKERNLMHWHDITAVALETSEILNPEVFSVNEFLNQMEYELPENCNGEASELSVFVNDEGKEELLAYPWKDDDKVRVIYE